MSARDDILQQLRSTLANSELRFPPPTTEPPTAEPPMTVTSAQGTLPQLARRFGQELEQLHGSYEIVETATEARLTLINRLIEWMEQDEADRTGAVVETGQKRSILTWDLDLLPISGLGPALEDMNLNAIAPSDLHTSQSREDVRFIRYGISGVEAAFASTGTMLVAAKPGASRAASLLPFYHVGLIPFSRLYPTIESWLAEQRQSEDLTDTVRGHANLTLITGPSKSADIEMNLTLGVHGPRFVHTILFDDAP